jgi:hypothetical protein
MEKGKVILWGGVGGCLFSALWGIVGGVSFLPLMIRSLLGGGFFALLLGGSLWVMERFLPELIQPMEGENEGGNQVDLVIPEHNPHLGEKAEEIIEPLSETREFEDFVEEVEEISKPLTSANSDTSTGASLLTNEETIDDLPDLGGFADAFEGGASPEVLTPGVHAGHEREKVLDGGDPAVLAKAIQTLLKKDKEG